MGRDASLETHVFNLGSLPLERYCHLMSEATAKPHMAIHEAQLVIARELDKLTSPGRTNASKLSMCPSVSVSPTTPFPNHNTNSTPRYSRKNLSMSFFARSGFLLKKNRASQRVQIHEAKGTFSIGGLPSIYIAKV